MVETSERRARKVTTVAVRPRSVMRVSLAMGLALAVSIAVATALLVVIAGVTGAHRPIDRMFTAVQHSHHLTTSQVIVAVGAALATLSVVGSALVGGLVSLFANHVLPLTGGLVTEEAPPEPRPSKAP